MKQFLALLLLTVIKVDALPLSQNDISILLPLPKADAIDLLLKPSTRGRFGELLSRAKFAQLPDLDMGNSADVYKDLRVVAIRIDPCFFQELSPAVCQPQIRFVWQPVRARDDGHARAEDAALHTFYNLDKQEFLTLISSLESLKEKAGSTSANEALDINPNLKTLGLQSTYAEDLFKLLLSNVGEERLSRITFMRLTGIGNIWIFGGFNVVNGVFQKMSIARVNSETQTFSNGVLGAVPNYFSGSISPAPGGADILNLLIRESSVIAPSDKDEIIETTLSAVRIENPLKHNANTSDCVSCHTAQPAKLWAIRQFPWLYLGPRAGQFSFTSKFDLTNKSSHPEKTTMLRGFGYDGDQPAISQRVINETARSLEQLGY